MLPGMDGEARKNLLKRVEADVARAVEIIAKARAEKAGEAVVSAIPGCEGLAFLFVSKVGLGLGMDSGHGFVIRRRPADEAKEGKPESSWSAPLFFQISSTGFGLTVGYTEMDSVVVLESRQAVTRFLEKQVEMGAGATATLGPLGEALPGNLQVLGGDPMSDKTRVFSLVSGGLQLDLSIKGLVTEVWPLLNEAAYGSRQAADPRGIMNGDVQPPACMQQLYDALAQ